MKRSRNAKGQFTQMSWRDRAVTINLLLLSLIGGYIVHYNSNYIPELISPYVEARGTDTPDNTEEVQAVSLPEPIKVAKITAYSCGGNLTPSEIAMNCPNGITATGTKPKYGTLACDKYNIGRKFKFEGIDKVFTCEDRGGSINGAGRFDIYLDTIGEAYQWGVKYLEYEEIK